MRAHVDDERCMGHGMCCRLCPEVFQLANKGYAVTRVSEVPERYLDLVREAVDQCPEGAISLGE
jgi:ferredoxin